MSLPAGWDSFKEKIEIRFSQGKLGLGFVAVVVGFGLRYNLTKFVKSRFQLIGTQ